MQLRYIVNTSKTHRKKLCPTLKNVATTPNTAVPALVAQSTIARTRIPNKATVCVAIVRSPAVNTSGALVATAAVRVGCLAAATCAWYCCS